MATGLAVQLGRYRWLHHVVAALRIFPIAGFVLRRYPIRRRLQPSGMVYRVTSLDQLQIEHEVFVRESYSPAVVDYAVRSFIDLGCNAGWFALWLSTVKPDPLRLGLLVDAHPHMVIEARWHLLRNGLSNFPVTHGAVGLPPNMSSAAFHLHPSTSASSLLPVNKHEQFPVKGKVADVDVPAVSVEDEWNRSFGNNVVDLMKIDIEGKELDFVRYEGPFLRDRVKRLIVEWHKSAVSLNQLDGQLAELGFERRGVYDEDQFSGLALYQIEMPSEAEGLK
jgi:FkbM family methyltransferase